MLKLLQNKQDQTGETTDSPLHLMSASGIDRDRELELEGRRRQEQLRGGAAFLIRIHKVGQSLPSSNIPLSLVTFYHVLSISKICSKLGRALWSALRCPSRLQFVAR